MNSAAGILFAFSLGGLTATTTLRLSKRHRQKELAQPEAKAERYDETVALAITARKDGDHHVTVDLDYRPGKVPMRTLMHAVYETLRELIREQQRQRNEKAKLN